MIMIFTKILIYDFKPIIPLSKKDISIYHKLLNYEYSYYSQRSIIGIIVHRIINESGPFGSIIDVISLSGIETV